MRKRVVGLLRSLDAQAVENRCGTGMPDIVYIGGWIETKKTVSFPKRAGTKVTLKHELLESQKVWLRRHARKGGQCWTLTQVANEFFLHGGTWAADFLGEVNRSKLTSDADLHCVGWNELEQELLPYLKR